MVTDPASSPASSASVNGPGPEGTLRASLGLFHGRETYWETSDAGIRGTTLPSSPRIVSFEWSNLAIVASTDSYEIRAFDLDGTLKRIVRRDHDLVAPTAAHMDAYIERRVAGTPEEEKAERRRELRKLYQDMPVPETHPAFTAAMADALDQLAVNTGAQI